MADLNELAALMQAGAGSVAPPMGLPSPPPATDAMGMGLPEPMGMPVPGAGMGIPGSFPSTSPQELALVVQEALAQLAAQDHQMLEMQQAQAAMQAQPLIDQMLMQASMPAPAPDPMMAFGEQAGMPPLPPEMMGMVA